VPLDGARAGAREALGALTVGAREVAREGARFAEEGFLEVVGARPTELLVGARFADGLLLVVERGVLAVGVLPVLLPGFARLTDPELLPVVRGRLAVGVLPVLLLGFARLAELDGVRVVGARTDPRAADGRLADPLRVRAVGVEFWVRVRVEPTARSDGRVGALTPPVFRVWLGFDGRTVPMLPRPVGVWALGVPDRPDAGVRADGWATRGVDPPDRTPSVGLRSPLGWATPLEGVPGRAAPPRAVPGWETPDRGVAGRAPPDPGADGRAAPLRTPPVPGWATPALPVGARSPTVAGAVPLGWAARPPSATRRGDSL
jgi:hypothetical protein